MSNVNDILDQLQKEWDRAEEIPFEERDSVIVKTGLSSYSIRREAGYNSEGEAIPHVRVLERAKPRTPEWEAVVASDIEDVGHRRQVFARNEWGKWESAHWIASDGELVDPVPLVEMPSREEIKKALVDAWGAWTADVDAEGGADPHRIDALLELLRGEREA